MTVYEDFRFTPTDDLADLGGPASRFNHNVKAIKLLKSLEAEGRPPGNLTPDEQLTLTRYSGWGDTEVFNHTFTQISGCEAEPCGKLRGLLTGEEIASLRASTLNAHYTRLDVIRSIYEAIERLGLASWGKLRILEPAAEIGHFLGAMPATLTTGAERVAVELDSITARILARLYTATRALGRVPCLNSIFKPNMSSAIRSTMPMIRSWRTPSGNSTGFMTASACISARSTARAPLAASIIGARSCLFSARLKNRTGMAVFNR
jgi:hypothetical protein